jgi:hypothetical protein
MRFKEKEAALLDSLFGTPFYREDKRFSIAHRIRAFAFLSYAVDDRSLA